MNVAAITGFSGSGKSTLIVALIELYRSRGFRVAAIKHTHHPFNADDRGDTKAFRIAGADPVILAAADGAAVHTAGGISRLAWKNPADLLAPCVGADFVLVEGFKTLDVPWPSFAIRADARPPAHEVAAELDRIWERS